MLKIGNYKIAYIFMKNNKKSSILRILLFFLFYQIIFVGISFFLLKRVGAFGCFDDCFNFGAGDFLIQGKQLYSQIFFNHQPFMAYISAAIQYITDPTTLFELVKYHRIALLAFANLCGSFLIFRFGLSMFVSLVVFESTKFYLFGDRFLAEGFIVYPMMYLVMLIGQALIKKRTYRWEYLLAAVCSWFIFWMREPFMPWAFVALGVLFVLGWKDKKNRKPMWIGLGVFTFLHLITVAFLPMSEYVFNVIVANVQHEIVVQPWTLHTIMHIIFYPVFVLLGGFGTPFQNVLWVLSGLLSLGFVYELVWKKRYGIVAVLLILLAIANLRVVPIGSLYYDAFHMIPWYGIFLTVLATSISIMWNEKKTKIYAVVAVGVVIGTTVLVSISSQSYMRESIDTQTEFTNGYGNYFVKGEVIKTLAHTGDTMFVEMWEDPIYFVAGVPTAYKYSWYTSIMPFFPMYRIAREEMFENNPPTFYVGACRKGETDSFALSDNDKQSYIQLLNSGNPSCIYVRNSIVPRITGEVSAKIKKYGYSLP